MVDSLATIDYLDRFFQNTILYMIFEKLFSMRYAAGLNTRQHKMKRLHCALTSMLAVLSSGRFTNHYLCHAEQVTRGADNSFKLRDDKPRG